MSSVRNIVNELREFGFVHRGDTWNGHYGDQGQPVGSGVMYISSLQETWAFRLVDGIITGCHQRVLANGTKQMVIRNAQNHTGIWMELHRDGSAFLYEPDKAEWVTKRPISKHSERYCRFLESWRAEMKKQGFGEESELIMVFPDPDWVLSQIKPSFPPLEPASDEEEAM